MAQKDVHGLEAWVEKLAKQDLPVLANVLKELNQLTAGDDTSANQLADAIMKDAALTSQVLRIANSVHYNPVSDSQFNTISRAVVQVGFKGIRAICISVMVIDSLLGKDPNPEVMLGMARSFHAGVQARRMAAISPSGAAVANRRRLVPVVLTLAALMPSRQPWKRSARIFARSVLLWPSAGIWDRYWKRR